MQENTCKAPLKGATEHQCDRAFQRAETASLPPVFSDEELSAVAMEYPLSMEYLSQLEDMNEHQAAFIISVAKFYGWSRDDSLSAVVKGWQVGYCPIQFFTFGGEGL